MIYTDAIATPLGEMTAAAKEGALVGLWFVGQKHYPSQTTDWIREPDHPVFRALRHHLSSYFSGKAGTPDVQIAPSGSSFQQTVWDFLLQIPPGRVVTYGEIARSIAQSRGLASMSAQAVGSAVGHNRISILVPCHRVIGSNGSLTGYAGGLERKEALLRIEGVDLAKIADSLLIDPFEIAD